MSRITKESHPFIHEAFEIISHDFGGGAGHEFYEVPQVYADHLPLFEETLRGCDAEGTFEDFCIGEMSDVENIARRSGALAVTNQFLNAFFDDWAVVNELRGPANGSR